MAVTDILCESAVISLFQKRTAKQNVDCEQKKEGLSDYPFTYTIYYYHVLSTM